jgi:hypothetical protein
MDQFSLFSEQKPARRLGGMPASVRQRWERAMEPDVAQAFLAILLAQPGKWLGGRDFRSVIDQYRVGFCYAAVLGRLERAGLVESKRVYFGKDPDKDNGLGYCSNWRVLAN